MVITAGTYSAQNKLYKSLMLEQQNQTLSIGFAWEIHWNANTKLFDDVQV